LKILSLWGKPVPGGGDPPGIRSITPQCRAAARWHGRA